MVGLVQYFHRGIHEVYTTIRFPDQGGLTSSRVGDRDPDAKARGEVQAKSSRPFDEVLHTDEATLTRVPSGRREGRAYVQMPIRAGLDVVADGVSTRSPR